jgi:hypothetical protein
MKLMQQQARAIANFKSDARSIVKLKSRYEEWIKKGRMTIEEVAEELKFEMDRVEIDLKAVRFLLLLGKPCTRYLPCHRVIIGSEQNYFEEYLGPTRLERQGIRVLERRGSKPRNYSAMGQKSHKHQRKEELNILVVIWLECACTYDVNDCIF